MAADDLVVRVPVKPGPVVATIGAEEFSVTRHDLARWLLNQPDMTGIGQQWLDMLGGLGLALKVDADGMVRMIISRPAAKVNINLGRHGDKASYKDTLVMMCPLVWVLSWRNEKLVRGMLYAAERPVRSLLDQARLCPFPFGNVDGGGICWGSAATTHLSIKNPLEIETLFFRSGLNEHLFVARWLAPGQWDRTMRNVIPTWVAANGVDTVLPIDWTAVRATTLSQALNLEGATMPEDEDEDEIVDEPEDEENA